MRPQKHHDATHEKLEMIRVKFLRLAHRLGQTPHNVFVAQVLYRLGLGLAEKLRGRNNGGFDHASAMAEQLEAAAGDKEPLDFSCTIMLIGKTGVGKSATINSIFDEVKSNTSAFHMGTIKVHDVVGTVEGIKVRLIDMPGLLPSSSDQPRNEKILHSVKPFIKKTPPDVVLYLDRLDMQCRARDISDDMPLLNTITKFFGPSFWFNAIVVLTHAASAPPEGLFGSYDAFVRLGAHVVQEAICRSAGDRSFRNPVVLVENHSACRTNRAGQRVLPNGQVWKPLLLLLCFGSKILAETKALLKFEEESPPYLPFLLSSLLQTRPQLKSASDYNIENVGETLNVERLFVLKDKISLSFIGQVTMDKKSANVQMMISSSGKATSLGFDMQTVGKDLAYTLHSETTFARFRRNEAAAGLSFTLLGDALSAGNWNED